MDKSYDPNTVEQKWYTYWIENNLHKSNIDHNKLPFSMVIPPPNVTGSLHIGHALNNTLQDILIRYKRMSGFDALWIPGMDHAGIATQLMVERELEKENLTKYDLGREKFIERTWEWKKESGGKIINQLKRLGALPDWTRQRFTLDKGLSKAVTKVFIDLYEEGLIYKDKRLVNWDPKLRTALSDLEVEPKEIKGNYWHIKYRIQDSEDYIIVATTRPETLLGDTAVAVHPDDERYKNIVGKKAIVPLCNRKIQIIADEYSDPTKGSGAVKITPAHDFNDFEVGQRHNLDMINILDTKANLNDEVPVKYRGLNRFEARKIIVSDLEDLGLVDKIEEVKHTVPYGDRSGVVVEPYLTDQWYVNAKELSLRAIEVVEGGEVKFYPRFWENTYLEWMRNIEPWCISRQLWWGHRIPAWYGPENKTFVAPDEESAKEQARKHYGKEVELTRDQDVLDTWFSSGLWPFSTMGWPEKTEDLKHYFPTNTLVTAFDIIFFWVARMIMMSLKFTGSVPFRDVYIHGLIRDENGQKMSKTKGNVIDPLDVIDEYGADSLRFTLTALSSQGRDIKLSYPVIEGYRNFMNKIWNASRFIIINLDKNNEYRTELKNSELNNIDKWVLSRHNIVLQQIQEYYDNYEFDKVSGSLYHFLWHDFCDWYIEISKDSLYSSNTKEKDKTITVLLHILLNSLKALHPVMPHITEEIYSIFSDYKIQDKSLCSRTSILLDSFPNADKDMIFDKELSDIEFLKEIISGVRNLRSMIRIHPSDKVEVIVRTENKEISNIVKNNNTHIKNLANLSKLITNPEELPDKSLSHVIHGVEIFLPVEGIKDIDDEIKRISKELDKVTREIQRSDNKLNSKDFINRAPSEVVEKEKSKFEEFNYQKEKLENVLSKLKSF